MQKERTTRLIESPNSKGALIVQCSFLNPNLCLLKSLKPTLGSGGTAKGPSCTTLRNLERQVLEEKN